MCKVIAALIFFASAAQAWTPITSKNKLSCEPKTPCFVEQKKDGLKFRIVFQTALEGHATAIKTVTIIEEKSKISSTFEMRMMSGVFKGEPYRFESLDLNADGYTDLALMAFSSARQGPIYHYFLYNPTAKKFVLSPEPYPELHLDPKTGLYQAQIGSFKLGQDFKIHPVQK